ncbi:hypothetical protein C8Q75DRAFT_222189 [Abortiporus biennis]|nr:hypothetical protein C8Q75DRAFT_222189 [Abortiporus biennis]
MANFSETLEELRISGCWWPPSERASPVVFPRLQKLTSSSGSTFPYIAPLISAFPNLSSLIFTYHVENSLGIGAARLQNEQLPAGCIPWSTLDLLCGDVVVLWALCLPCKVHRMRVGIHNPRYVRTFGSIIRRSQPKVLSVQLIMLDRIFPHTEPRKNSISCSTTLDYHILHCAYWI